VRFQSQAAEDPEMILEIVEAARAANNALTKSQQVCQETKSLAWKDLLAEDVRPHALPES